MARVQPKYSLWYLLHLANRGICFSIWRRTSGVHPVISDQIPTVSELRKIVIVTWRVARFESLRGCVSQRPPSQNSRCSREYLGLWRSDPSGDIRERGAPLAASLLLTGAGAQRRAGGPARRHSRRFGLLGRVSEPLPSATCDLRTLPVLTRATNNIS